MTGILYVLLNLPFLPAGSGVAELRLEQEVAHHGREADVDLAFLAAADLVDGRLHVVVDAPPWHAAQHPEGVVMGIKQHLVGLEQVGSKREGPTVGQLDMGDLELGALAGNCPATFGTDPFAS